MNAYWRLYLDSRGKAAISIAMSLLELAAILPVPVLVKTLFDRAVAGGEVGRVVQTVAALAALRIIAAGISLYTRRLSLGVTKTAIERLRALLYEKLYSLSYRDVMRRDISELHTLIVDDTERVDVMSAALLSIFIPAALGAIGLGAVLLFLSPKLTLIILMAAPGIFLVHKLLGTSIRARVDRFRKAFEKFSRGALFVVRGLELTRGSGATRIEAESQRAALREVRDAGVAMAWSHAAYASIQNLAVSVTMLVVLGVGGAAVARGTMSIGTLAGFYAAAALFAGVSNNLWSSLPPIISGNRSLAELTSLLHAESDGGYAGRQAISFKGGITLNKVRFSYDSRDILSDATLAIHPGETVTLGGLSGAGKTTLVRLILGFEQPDGGSIFADGVSYEELEIAGLVRQIGVLPQDPFIFTGTIAENIAYARPRVSEEVMRQAIEDAGAARLIDQLPRGVETVVGDEGKLLSGGQRQRIALARAVTGRPRLLILDEPGNHLEKKSISELLERFRTWTLPPSVLLVSHVDIKDVCIDRRYCIEGGVIREIA